jgi:hypothetical protein
MDIFDTSEIPEAYKTHFPPEAPDPQGEAGEMLLEPFAQVSQKIKDSLSRIYRVASQPMGGDEVVKPLPRETNPVEYYGSLAARVIALPLVAMKEVYDLGTSARTGAPKLRGGPAGEGDWSPEQYKVAAEATFTAGAAIGGGTPGGGRGPVNMIKKPRFGKLGELTAKEIFETPHGKVRYDSSAPFYEGGPKMHQYTIQEGPAKGATFSAKSQSMDEISRLTEDMIKMRTKLGKEENVAAREAAGTTSKVLDRSVLEQLREAGWKWKNASVEQAPGLGSRHHKMWRMIEPTPGRKRPVILEPPKALPKPTAKPFKKGEGPTLSLDEATKLDKLKRLQQTQGYDWGKDPQVHYIPEISRFMRVMSKKPRGNK